MTDEHSCDVRTGVVHDPERGDVFAIGGDIDLASASKVVSAAAPVLARPGNDPVLLDLGEVTFLDSTGVGCLLEIRSQALAAGRETRIVATSAQVDRVLALAGLADVFSSAEQDA